MNGAEVVGIVGIIVAGGVGPWMVARAGAAADQRRFRHERALAAADDLRACIDALTVALDELASECGALRLRLATASDDASEEALDVRTALSLHARARSAIVRLMIRPHASSEMVDAAAAGAAEFRAAAMAVRVAILQHRLAPDEAPPLTTVNLASHLDEGLAKMAAFQLCARGALDALVGTAEIATAQAP